MRTAMALLAALALVVVAGWVIDDVALGHDIPRNVTADGVEIGGLDKADAREALGTPSVLTREITLAWAGDSITRSAEELGVEFDAQATTDRAAERGGLLARPFRWLGSLVSGRDVRPVIALAPDALRPLFSTGVDAAFEIQRETPVIELIDGAFVSSDPGSVPVPDVVALAASVLEALATDADPVVVEVPTLDEQLVLDGPEIIAEINEITAGGVSVSLVGDSEIHAIPETVVRSWIVLGGTAANPSVSLDDDAVLDTLRTLFVGVGDAGEQAEFLVDYIGGVHITGGAPGSVCCRPDTADRLLDALRNDDDVVDVWPREDPDAKGVTWAESLGITELVGEFTTNYVAGQTRVENIRRIAELTRGAVIEPGQTFSVNDHLGRRTTENGFVAAGVISNGVFSESVGGGISQYATTLFNAAFFAGLDFGEYQSHSIYISRYPYGREATISFPAPDLQIVNDTPHGVLLWPTTTADSITVQLYSTRTVSGEQTGQTERREGTSCTRVTTERTRTWLDGRTEIDTVTARYRPEGVNCDGSSTRPTTTTTAPPPASTTTTTAPPPASTTTTTAPPPASTTTTTEAASTATPEAVG